MEQELICPLEFYDAVVDVLWEYEPEVVRVWGPRIANQMWEAGFRLEQ